MADNGIKIKDLDTVAATQDDDYVVLNNNNLTTKMLATDFKKEISGPISKTLQQEINDRSVADEKLQSSLEQEETNRQLADTSLENSINKCKKVFEYF